MKTATLCSLSLLFSSCVALSPREEPTSALTKKIAHQTVPEWASDRINSKWWERYKDEALSNDITSAFFESADLQIIAAKLEQAEAQAEIAKFAAWPKLNLGYGFGNSRVREIDFGPYTRRPWSGSGNLQWEFDIWGKLRRSRESAKFARNAVWWELAGAKLMLATKITEARFRYYRLDEEESILTESIEANRKILKIFRDREKAGLIAMTDVHIANAEQENLLRAKEDLARLKQLAIVELETLVGGLSRDKKVVGHLPLVPDFPSRQFDELIKCHPSILAAESEVRSAFKLEEVSRLDLLPSFSLNGNLMGASSHFFLDELGTWERSIGVALDIPVFDPARFANLDSRRGKTKEAAAYYRKTLVEIVGEIDTAYINFQSRRAQYESLCREVDDLDSARTNILATFHAGIVSQTEVLESERNLLVAKRAKSVMHHAILSDHLALVRALGGPCCTCSD